MFKFSSVPAYSFGKRKDKHSPDDLPGPGAYDKSLDYKGRLGKMGKAPRGINFKSDVPGPGAYDPNANQRNLKKIIFFLKTGNLNLEKFYLKQLGII